MAAACFTVVIASTSSLDNQLLVCLSRYKRDASRSSIRRLVYNFFSVLVETSRIICIAQCTARGCVKMHPIPRKIAFLGRCNEEQTDLSSII